MYSGASNLVIDHSVRCRELVSASTFYSATSATTGAASTLGDDLVQAVHREQLLPRL